MISHLVALAGRNNTDLDFSWKGKESEVVCCFANHPRTKNSKLNTWSLEARFMVMLALPGFLLTYTLQAVFRRYLRPEKDSLSFSLIYKKGDRSLDLVSRKQSLSMLDLCLSISCEFWYYCFSFSFSRSARTMLRLSYGFRASRH